MRLMCWPWASKKWSWEWWKFSDHSTHFGYGEAAVPHHHLRRESGCRRFVAMGISWRWGPRGVPRFRRAIAISSLFNWPAGRNAACFMLLLPLLDMVCFLSSCWLSSSCFLFASCCYFPWDRCASRTRTGRSVASAPSAKGAQFLPGTCRGTSGTA